MTRNLGVPFVPADQVNMPAVGKVEIAAFFAVGAAALALVALVWLVAGRTIQDQRTEVRYRAEQTLKGQAATIAETVAHELLVIDQSLSILQAAWAADSDSVNLLKYQERMPALTAVADDLFISDERHVIRQDIVPKAVGQGIGAAYVTFPHGSLETFQSDGTKDKDALILQADGGAPIDAREFLMYVVRPLDHPKGWLIGASYRSAELTKLFAEAALGFNPVVALVDTRRGNLQAVVGPAARRPHVDLSKTPLFGLITRAASGTWEGDDVVDSTRRIIAFQQVPNRDMAVIIGASMAEVMAPADTLAAGAHALATVGTALVLAIGGLVLWELYTIRGHRRRQRVLDRNKRELERLRLEDAANSARVQINAARLLLVLTNIQDGVALFDSALRLVQWNLPFQRWIGVEPRSEMPLETLLREQIAAGLFGGIANIETEVANRSALLRAGDPAGLPLPGPHGEALFLRGLPVPEGGIMLLLNGLVAWEPPPPLMDGRVFEEPTIDVPSPAPVEW